MFTAIGGDPASKGGQIMQKFGESVRKLMTKFWIWVVTITLFAIGILGDQMSLFRILYMALALVFVLTFQVCRCSLPPPRRTFCLYTKLRFPSLAFVGHLAQNYVRILVSCDHHLHDNTSHDIYVPVWCHQTSVGANWRRWNMVAIFSIFIYFSNVSIADTAYDFFIGNNTLAWKRKVQEIYFYF